MISARDASPTSPEKPSPSSDPLALQKATYYRLFPAHTRTRASHQVLSRRPRLADLLQDSPDISGRSTPVLLPQERPPTVTVEEHQVDDYNFSDDGHGHDTEQQECWDAQVYRAICRRLGVIPCASFIRRLSTERMSLKYQSLTPEDIKACSVALVNNVSVTHLDLEGNDMRASGARRIAEMLRENIYITHVSLAENAVRTEGLRHMCALLSDNHHVLSVDLSGNGLRDEDAVYLANMLHENNTLRSLRVRHNEFRDKGGRLIGKAIAANDTLEVLDLAWNHLRGEGAVAVCQGLQDNNCLRDVNLSWNGLHLTGCRALGQALAMTSALETLDITCNRIDVECLKPLLLGLKENKSLRVLKIARNYLTNAGVEDLLTVIQDHPALYDLDLGHQYMDERSMELIADIRRSRVFHVRHGPVLREDGGVSVLENHKLSFVNDDPMMVVMEFMRIRNLRLVDLFHSLDKDGSQTLDKEEFRKGLLGSNIPMHFDALDKLIDKLDTNNDGEVDFAELMAGRKLHRRKLTRMKERIKERSIPFARTELGQINAKLRTLMALRSGFKPTTGLTPLRELSETNIEVGEEEETEFDEMFRKQKEFEEYDASHIRD